MQQYAEETAIGAVNLMYDGSLHISGRARKISLFMALTSLSILFVLSARTIIGTYYHNKIQGILDDRSSEENITLKDLSEDTVPAYLEAIGILERTIYFDPSRALYRKALSDIYDRIGSWSENMELMNAPLPAGAPVSKETSEHAIASIREAITRQPTNPDNHLAYGHLLLKINKIDDARSEYGKSVNAYPNNSALRYAVALEYLAGVMNADAMMQAKELAWIDDSYMTMNADKKQPIHEQRATSYLNRLYGSYLFKAFEIVWRTSGSNMDVVRSIVPNNNGALDAFELFAESKCAGDKQLLEDAVQ
jgi:tetratricopeptide (TPR) repeat protein